MGFSHTYWQVKASYPGNKPQMQGHPTRIWLCLFSQDGPYIILGKADMQMMNKKILAVALCIVLGSSLAACGSQNAPNVPDSPAVQDTQEASAGQEENQENALASTEENQENTETKAMTDEELLSALGDNIIVIAEDAYAETVKAFLEQTDDYIGKIYQIKGSFVKEGENQYLTVNTGEEGDGIRIPLKCLVQEPEAGSHVRVTGIVNYGDVDGESVPVLDVAVIETLSE